MKHHYYRVSSGNVPIQGSNYTSVSPREHLKKGVVKFMSKKDVCCGGLEVVDGESTQGVYVRMTPSGNPVPGTLIVSNSSPGMDYYRVGGSGCCSTVG